MKENQVTGLTKEEVAIRKEQGYINTTLHTITKTKKQILSENIFTLFNLLNVSIALALAYVGAWSNLLFIFIILMNVAIGIAQELHAKKLVDELSLLMVPTVHVMRDNALATIHVDDLVMDDIMVLDSGMQICCDAVLVDGEVEVNESLLTGESDPIHKSYGDSVLSGSSVISGKCSAKVIHVGNDNYTAKLTNEVKKVKKIHSELLDSMRKVTKVTSIMILPLGVLLFVEAFFLRDGSLYDSVVGSAAGLLGMLPKGLVLLISVSLAAGVGKLAKQKVLIQDLYSLETLAHVDTLCLDKTGTITNGLMKVEEVIFLSDKAMDEMLPYISSFFYHSDDNNATNEAMRDYFKASNLHEPLHKIPFSSLRKWSAVCFDDKMNLIMGAPERLMHPLPSQLEAAIHAGKRVIIIASSETIPHMDQPLPTVTPWLAVVLTDTIRKDVEKTLAYFKQEGVDIKVISGDHVKAVSAIAKMAGLDTYQNYIDMSTIDPSMADFDDLVNSHSVFGRVTPKQKKQLVQALQRMGHTVAMTGDGVNDMLALKEADCSIAIAEGSDAVKQLAQVVLLESDFACLPQILLEGRRVVNNVTRVAGVFFIKTIYSIVISLLCAVMNIPFPFIPIQITLIDFSIEAFPAFLTLLEPSDKAVRGRFLPTVFKNAIPNAVSIIFMVLTFWILQTNLQLHDDTMMTMMYLCVGVISIQAVIVSSLPFNRLRALVCLCMIAGFSVAILLFGSLLHLESLSYQNIILTAIFALSALLVKFITQTLIQKKISK